MKKAMHQSLLITLLAIARGLEGTGRSDAKSDVRRWNLANQDITQNLPRVAEFSEAAWNVHCNPQEPSHQHLLKSPNQKCDAPFPGLVPLRPLHNAEQFGWSNRLEASWVDVKEELEGYLDAVKQESWKTSTTSLCENTNGFTKLTLRDHRGNPTSIGKTHFPKTVALLKDMVGPCLAPRPVNINCQAPNSGLAPHSDNMNFLLTCHLGICIPKQGECVFRIGEEDYQWKDGKVVIADTSFIHETINTSPSEARYVLSFCIWHPDLSEEERHGIVAIHSILQQFA